MVDISRAEQPACGDTITWFGHSCFRVTDADGHTVVTDPYAAEVMGQSLSGLTADVVIITHEHYDHNAVDAVQARHVIHALAELPDKTIKRVGDAPTGLIFTLIPTYHDEVKGHEQGENVVVVWQEGGIIFCHLGDLGQPLNDRQVEAIGRPDVLMLPVGGHFTINGAEARAVVKQLRPHVVIPMHYKVPGMSDAHLPITTVDPFLHADGREPWDSVQRLDTSVLTVDVDHLPNGTEVDVLTAVKIH